MTRTCAWCGKFLGEVCPECGGRAWRLGRIARWLWRPFFKTQLLSRVYVCSNWRAERTCYTFLFFAGGNGPMSHGICAECRAKENERERRAFESLAARRTLQ